MWCVCKRLTLFGSKEKRRKRESQGDAFTLALSFYILHRAGQLIIIVPVVDDIRIYIVIWNNQRPGGNRLSIRAYIRTGIQRRGIRIDPTGQRIGKDEGKR